MIFILGATGSGKTAVSLLLARHLQAEVVNADALQTYRGFEVGTAKVTAAEMGAIPHHGFDLIDPATDPTCTMTMHVYLEFAVPKISDILGRGKHALVVGGSHMYLNALIWTNPRRSSQDASDIPLHATTARRRENFARFGGVDAEKRELRFPTSRFVLMETSDEAWMRTRLDARVDAMFAAGLAEEAAKAREIFQPGKGVLQAIGYTEFLEETEPEMIRQRIKENTWKYVKKQTKWLRNSLVPKFHIEPVKISMSQKLAGSLAEKVAELLPEIFTPIGKSEEKPKKTEIFACEKCDLKFPGTLADWNFHLKSSRHRKQKPKK